MQSETDRKQMQWWRLLMYAQATRSACDRAWAFFIPLYLGVAQEQATGNGGSGTGHISLRPTALLYLCTTLFQLVLSPRFAAAYSADRAIRAQHRPGACCNLLASLGLFSAEQSQSATFLVAEYTSLALSAVCLWCYAHRVGLGFNHGDGAGGAVWLCGAGVLVGIEATISRVLLDVVEKHEVYVMARGTNRNTNNVAAETPTDGIAVKLSKFNAQLTQIDLIAAAFMPVLVSEALSRLGADASMVFLVAVQFIAALSLSQLMEQLSMSQDNNGDSTTTNHPTPMTTTSSTGNNNNNGASITSSSSDATTAGGSNAVVSIFKQCVPNWHSLKTIDSDTQRLVLSYVFLFFTVVSPGGVFNAWLQANGISPRKISLFAVLAQCSGMVGTALAPPMVQRVGVVRAAQIFQRSQAVAVACFALFVGTSSSFSSSGGNGGGGDGHTWWWTVIILVCVSRVGLWGFDLMARQLVQRACSDENRIEVFATQTSISQLCMLLMHALTLAFPEPKDFKLLCGFSAVAVSTSSCLLWRHRRHRVIGKRTKSNDQLASHELG